MGNFEYNATTATGGNIFNVAGGSRVLHRLEAGERVRGLVGPRVRLLSLMELHEHIQRDPNESNSMVFN